MAKKNFKLAPNIAKGITDSIKTVSSHKGDLNYNIMDINLIEPDPENPRTLSISIQDIKKNPKEFSEAQKKDFESLLSLAKSIKKVGVRNAIEVYKFNNKYRLIAGERRWLASLIAGKDFIPVKITNKLSEFDLKYLQWIENIQREGLSLWETFNNLKQLSDAFSSANKGTQITAKIIEEIVDVSQRQSYRLYNLLNANKEVLEAVKKGKIKSYSVFDEISRVNDPHKQKKLLIKITSNDFSKNKDLLQLIRAETKNIPLKPIKSRAGRPSKKINLGVVENQKSAKLIFDIIISHDFMNKYKSDFKDIDWNSNNQINHAFKRILNIIKETA